MTDLASLIGSRVTGIGRTGHLMEIGFDRDGVRQRLTAYCPLRVVRHEQILLGSADMNYPVDRDRDPEEAYQAGATMYDRNATRLTAMFAGADIRVLAATLDVGAIAIDATDSFRFEVMPASARRRLEAWRLISGASPADDCGQP